MTEEEETLMHQRRDTHYDSVSKAVYNGSPENFIKGFLEIQEDYKGTSYQKKYYPEKYQEYIESLTQKTE
ncbi:MAG: hypothetical protein CL528_11430 [Aequorivita sp.]|nr:hypothetical protein [Aequorivita sp.]MBP42378.1 hypothetical protein [Aequorivita sp.]|tara:strand:- start:3261 stop:3470 length:210 start_codon:yes stop_codon:yes gene_type:complete